MGRTLFYCADVKTIVSSFWGFTKRELSKNWVSPEPSVQSKIRLSLANCPKKEQCQVNGIQPFLLSRNMDSAFSFCQELGKSLFLIVKDLGNLLFSVSRLWKISLFDCSYTTYISALTTAKLIVNNLLLICNKLIIKHKWKAL